MFIYAQPFPRQKPVVYWAVVTSNTLHILLTFHLSGQKSHEINENLSKGSAHVKRELRLSLRTSVWLRKNGTFERAERMLWIVYTHVQMEESAAPTSLQLLLPEK